jgi:hypothetical protein
MNGGKPTSVAAKKASTSSVTGFIGFPGVSARNLRMPPMRLFP